MLLPGLGLSAVATLGVARYRTLRKSPNYCIAALFATGVEILVAVSVALLVGNHHGNGISTKPLMRSA
jgi:hypothetical protein